jgi:CDP-paratose 2-epimerase
MNILITGGAGFVGSNLALLLKKNYPDYHISCLDNLKRRGSELNLPRLKTANIEFIHGDIRNKEDFESVKHCDLVIEASAEPSVLAGVSGTPDYVVNTNLFGTLNCLDFARKHNAKVLFLSTSRVYSIAPLSEIRYTESGTRFEIAQQQTVQGITTSGIAEHFPMDTSRSFYGTTKLASEFFIQEYAEFYGLETIINRCGVLTGPWQMGKIDQGVVILWLSKHFWKQKLAYIGYGGTGKQVRDILHIHDLYRLLDLQIHDFSKFSGEVFNVGGGREISVSLLELTACCENITGHKITIDAVTENRPADIPIYISDHRKITERCGWTPQIGVESILQECYEWMKEYDDVLKQILS